MNMQIVYVRLISSVSFDKDRYLDQKNYSIKNLLIKAIFSPIRGCKPEPPKIPSYGSRLRIRNLKYVKPERSSITPRRQREVLSPLAATRSAGRKHFPSLHGRHTPNRTARPPCAPGPPVSHVHP
jgi:hypothetical protein